MRPRVPKTMTAEKLRVIADYIDECDHLVAQALDLFPLEEAMAAAQKLRQPDRLIQTDLRQWADEISR